MTLNNLFKKFTMSKRDAGFIVCSYRFPNKFCKWTESASLLSTNTSKLLHLYLFRSNHFVASFSWRWKFKAVKNIGRIWVVSIDTKGLFLTVVSFKSLGILREEFLSSGQTSVSKCLTVHVPSNCYNATKF